MRTAGRILVIDEDPRFLATMQDLLMDERYVVDGVTTVGAALDLLWQDWEQQPDAILVAEHLSAGEPFTELYGALRPVTPSAHLSQYGMSTATTTRRKKASAANESRERAGQLPERGSRA